MAGRRNLAAIGCLSLALILIGPIGYFLWSQVFVHDWMLARFRQTFAAVRHPATTMKVRAYSDLGLLIGNGNHCDFFTGELRSYSCSRRDVLNAYAAQSFRSPFGSEQLPVEVVFIENGRLRPGIIVHGDTGYDGPFPLERILSKEGVILSRSNRFYIVYLFDPGYPVGFDIRCM